MPLIRSEAATFEMRSGNAPLRHRIVIAVIAITPIAPKNQLACSAPFMIPKAMPVLCTRTRLKNPGITSMMRGATGSFTASGKFETTSHFVH